MKPHVWTNIAYLIAGCFLMASGLHIAGLGLLFLGYASWIGHSKGGKWWYLDWAGMYVAFIAVISQNLGIDWYSLIVYPPVVALTLRYRIDSVLLIGVLLAVSLVTGYMIGTSVFTASLLFATAFLVRQIPQKQSKWYNIIHGTWHILTALAIAHLVLK